MRYTIQSSKVGFIVFDTRSLRMVGGPYVEGKAWAVAARLNGYSSIKAMEEALAKSVSVSIKSTDSNVPAA